MSTVVLRLKIIDQEMTVGRTGGLHATGGEVRGIRRLGSYQCTSTSTSTSLLPESYICELGYFLHPSLVSLELTGD